MSFCLCPLSETGAKLAAPAFKKRIPISERARRLQERKLPAEAMPALDREGHIRIRNADVFFFPSDITNQHAAVTIVSYLCAVFDRHSAGLWLRQSGDNAIATLVGDREEERWLTGKGQVREIDFMFPEKIRSLKAQFFYLQFILDKEEMIVNQIVSEEAGHGGPAIAALYGIAKGTGLKRIGFSVTDLSAARFHFHMDFGRPVENIIGKWEAVLGK